nr:endonuclease/exonuclease/phosphatase family protein [Palleronia pontilimi]
MVSKTALLMALLAALVVGCQNLRLSGKQELRARDGSALRIATYNVHYIVLADQTGPWSVGDWERRKGPLDQAFKALDADLVAFQEMESFRSGSDGSVNLARDWLLDRNPGYGLHVSGDWTEFPSTQPMLYRRDRLEPLDQGWFFFSETPDQLYSRTFNGSYPAFASWGQFRDKRDGAVFTVVNAHTDYASRQNRLLSAELIARRIAPRVAAGDTVFLTGDLNARLGDRTLEIVENAGLTFAPVRGATYHFDRGLNLFRAIDHIAFTDDVTLVSDPVVLRRRFDGEWPTDHYPVAVDVRLD